MGNDAPCITSELGHETGQEVFSLNRKLLDDHGITNEYLIKKLKSELNAKVTRLVTLKMGVEFNTDGQEVPAAEAASTGKNGTGKKKRPSQYKLPKKIFEGKTILSRSGCYKEVVIAVDMEDNAIRQRARMDAHKLRADYPPDRIKHSGTIQILAPEPITKPPNTGRAEPDAEH